jgi:hypothetical protein
MRPLAQVIYLRSSKKKKKQGKRLAVELLEMATGLLEAAVKEPMEMA